MARSAALVRWWRRHAIARINHVAIVARVTDESGWTPGYLLMTLLSAGIALLGLLLSSPAVVIGAMLISPLMGPIMGVGFAFAVFDLRELRRAGVALVAGSVIAILFAALITLASPLQTVTAEIAGRTRPNLFDLVVALLSALAGAYALIRGRGATIVGVAIATALMPPLATVGFGLATWNGAVFGGALLLFVTNLVTIALTTTALARIYGFGARLSPHQSWLQAAVLAIVLVALAVPLGLSLRQIAWESIASRRVRDNLLAVFPDDARLSQVDIDYDHDPLSVRAVVLTPKFARGAAKAAERALAVALGRRTEISLDQLLIGRGAANSEAAELVAVQAKGSAAVTTAATDEALRHRVAEVAGVPPGSVLIDPAAHHIVARAGALPDAGLATYRALEQRLGASAPDWTVSLVPPLLSLPTPPFAGDRPTPDGAAALALAGWASARTAVPVRLTGGNPARRAAGIALIQAAGGTASGEIGGATLTLDWALPRAAPPAE